ncbi:MAG: RimK/LysX family protein [Fimbriimonadaceae bacterium]|nr:RimK/LysX family protein [Fimbriimonadaceae bacterium]QYK58608.1 MAG: RimK/LysX family protein [Fimbriimonadaceae bacterium]
MAKTVVGWREYVSLPDWGIFDLHAKIDTGARTSAVHVEGLELVSPGVIRFDVVLDRRHRHTKVAVEEPVVRMSHVKSSNGQRLERYFVKTTLVLGSVSKVIEISLVNRDNMTVRMLIGRTALGDNFLVDAHAQNLLGKPAQ